MIRLLFLPARVVGLVLRYGWASLLWLGLGAVLVWVVSAL